MNDERPEHQERPDRQERSEHREPPLDRPEEPEVPREPDPTEPRLFSFSEPAPQVVSAPPSEPVAPTDVPAPAPPPEPPPTRLQPIAEPPPVHSPAMTTAREAAPPREQTAPRRPGARPARRIVRRRATIRKVDPWSVLKLSLVFYFCALLVVMMGLFLFWSVIYRVGLMDRLLGFLADLQLEVTIHGGMIARAVFLIGLLNVVLWSGISVFLAFLYNLIADLIGGLKVTLAEEE